MSELFPIGHEPVVRPINWNEAEDPIDVMIWNRLTTNFWLPEKVALSNDIPDWNSLDEYERTRIMRAFAELTVLDTLQSNIGAPTLAHDAVTQHEEAVFSNITFMEAVHAKSYSSIFMTLASTPDINDAFNWASRSKTVQEKAGVIASMYQTEEPLLRKAASVFLESFLFYSGFFLPLHYLSHGKLTNTADIIKLIIRDEAVHGYYIGYKFQKQIEGRPENQRDNIKRRIMSLSEHLMEVQKRFVYDLYKDDETLRDQAWEFCKYNLSRAFNNLGFDGDHIESDPPQAILNAMNLGISETHDFFSGSGSSYTMGPENKMAEEDWEL